MSANSVEASNGKPAKNRMQQPANGAPVAAGVRVLGPWTTGLFGCFQDTSNCCFTCCCPCITFGRNVEIIDQGKTSCVKAGITYCILAHIFGLSSCYAGPYRRKLRGYLSLSKDPCDDCLVHCFCLPCAVYQEYRELKIRGLNPSHGWTANAEKWSQVMTGPPLPPSFEACRYR